MTQGSQERLALGEPGSTQGPSGGSTTARWRCPCTWRAGQRLHRHAPVPVRGMGRRSGSAPCGGCSQRGGGVVTQETPGVLLGGRQDVSRPRRRARRYTVRWDPGGSMMGGAVSGSVGECTGDAPAQRVVVTTRPRSGQPNGVGCAYGAEPATLRRCQRGARTRLHACLRGFCRALRSGRPAGPAPGRSRPREVARLRRSRRPEQHAMAHEV